MSRKEVQALEILWRKPGRAINELQSINCHCGYTHDASVSVSGCMNLINYVMMHLTSICAVSSVCLVIIMGHYLNYGSVNSQSRLIREEQHTHTLGLNKRLQQTPRSAVAVVFWRVWRSVWRSHQKSLITPSYTSIFPKVAYVVFFLERKHAYFY